MPDTYWIIDRGSNRPTPWIPIDAVTFESPAPTPALGADVQLDCIFTPTDAADYSTLSQSAVTGQTARYEAVRDYLSHASAVVIHDDIDGAAYFTDPEGDRDPVETHFVRVRPPSQTSTPDFYGAITGGDVTKQSPSGLERLELTITYLGAVDPDRWPTRTLARDALEA